MKTRRTQRVVLLVCILWLVHTGFAAAQNYNIAKDRARSAAGSPRPTSPPSSSGSGTGLSVPADFNKEEHLDLKGKFYAYRPGDNAIVFFEGTKYYTVYANKSTKLARGGKPIQPKDLKDGDLLQAKVTKSKGMMTANEIAVSSK
jgi:hypothetical protein